MNRKTASILDVYDQWRAQQRVLGNKGLNTWNPGKTASLTAIKMMSLTVLVSCVSSQKELISLREPQTSSPSLLLSTGTNDLDERLTCWSETDGEWPRREQTRGPNVRCEMRNTISLVSNEGLPSEAAKAKITRRIKSLSVTA